MKDALRVTLALTGASGMPIANSLLHNLLLSGTLVNLIISKAGLLTYHQEMGVVLSAKPEQSRATLLQTLSLANGELLQVYNNQDWYAPMASGSSVDDAMVICPCSMASLGRVALGCGEDLISRAADVCLKERKNLILVPRETPFSALHLENMLKLARLGVAILPPLPAFYTHPQTIQDIIDFIVSRILDQIGVSNQLVKRW